MGQPFILSEYYGLTGWQLDFADHKYIGDWQALFGINLRCHHLSCYTLEGQAKRDYPDSILHQSAWYRDYNFVETYYARLGYLLGQGHPDCDVLVLNPVESLWSQICIGWSNGFRGGSPEIQDLESYYRRMFHALQGNQIDFDYGDEDILMRYAKVYPGAGGRPVLQVGQAGYTTVVLGGLTTIRSSTLKLLKEFAGAGGLIILAGDPPAYVDASHKNTAGELEDIALKVPFEEQEIAEVIRKYTSIPAEAIEVESGNRIPDLFCQVKRDGDRTIFAVLNVSRDLAYDNVLLKIEGKGDAYEWYCETGVIRQVETISEGNMLGIRTSFSEAEEHIYTITPETIPNARKPINRELMADVYLSGPFSYSLDEPNVCVLDMGYVEIDNESRSQLLEILKIDQLIRDHFDLPQRSGDMVQPWFKRKFYGPPKSLGKIRIHYPFFVDELPEDGMEFCMETPHEFSVKVNGQKLKLEDQGWWVDIAIRRFNIPSGMLREGENMLVQEFEFRDDLDLEASYLLGNFSVRLEGSKKILGKLPERISTGDLTGQGLPFYTGKVLYKIPLFEDYTEKGQVVLEVPEYEAACITVNPDGTDPAKITWQPNRVDITDQLNESAELTLELVLTRRNTFGPLHHNPLNFITGPGHFLSTGEMFTMNYMLYPSGILKNPRLLVYKWKFWKFVQ